MIEPNMEFIPGKLLLSVVGKRYGEKLVIAGRAAGAKGGTILQGRGTSMNKVLRLLALGDIAKDVVLTLLEDSQVEAVVHAHIAAAAVDAKHMNGVMALMDVSKILRHHVAGTNDAQRTERSMIDMEAKWELITVIVNSKYADEAMVAARKAGASGGTILNARGTGTEKDVKFFGLSLVPEKEMLLILSEKGQSEKILEAIKNDPSLQAPGSGIVYCVDVQQFHTLGQA